ncbi:putative p22 protein precursor [Diplonema papillatum]|nr:putative p22 protein precursor [Diplonema papillatum]
MMSIMRRASCRVAASAFARRADTQAFAPKRFLVSAANGELQDEKSLLADMESKENLDAPAGWSLTYTEGKGFFRMSKADGGVEVVIDCEFKAHSSDDGTTGFTVLFTRNGITADFTLVYDEGEHSLKVEGLTTYHNKSTAVDLTPQAECDRDNHYEGPQVEDLETTEVCTKVLELLEANGVSSDLGQFIHKKVQHLEQKAYCGFLQDLATLAA